MASIIRIKRSSTSGNPSTLGAGELAYSALGDNGSNGGDRLYIGMGTETAGNAVNHIVIGGKYFTDKLDHTPGTLTATSAIITDANSKIDNLLVDNLQLNGNTISSTNTNGDITLSPNGTGAVNLYNPYIDQSGTLVTLAEYIQDVAGGGIVDSSEIDATYDDTAGTTSLALKTTGVTAGSYGSTTKIPTFTVDSKGRLTAAGEANVATALSIAGDTGTDTVDLLTDTLTISGGEGIDVAVTNNTITIAGEDATTTNKGVASFDTNNFTVTSGAVSAKSITLGSSTLTLGSTTTNLAGLGTLGATGAVTFGSTLAVTGNTTVGGTLGLTGAATLSSTLGVAGDFAVNTNKFTVAATSGNTAVGGTLAVTGNTTVGGTLGVTGNTTLSGTLAVTNDLAINTNKFNVTASSGNTSIAGTLGVTGATTLSSTLGVTGNTTVGGTLSVTGVITAGSNIDANSHKIVNLAEPTADSDAATKYYVDAARSGLDIKNSVRVATTANITLSNTQTIDGVALSVGDRVLVKDQNTASQNGIYVVASGSWTRSTDADQPAELNPGTFVFVEEGSVNSDTGFVVVSDGALVIGTDPIEWTLFSTSGTLIAGNGLSKNGYTLEVNVANGIEIASDNVQLASSVAGAGLTYTSGVLDVVGTSNRITVNSNSIDIASTYVGQASITTLGTVTSGTWNADVIADAYVSDALTISGGTVNNTPIGATTRSSGAFTTLAANGAVTFTSTAAISGDVTLSANLSGAGAGTSTLDGFNIDGGTY